MYKIPISYILYLTIYLSFPHSLKETHYYPPTSIDRLHAHTFTACITILSPIESLLLKVIVLCNSITATVHDDDVSNGAQRCGIIIGSEEEHTDNCTCTWSAGRLK